MTNPTNPYGSQPEQGYSQVDTGQLGYGQPGTAPIQPGLGQPGPQGYYPPMTTSGQQRPTGVTMISVWNWILAGLLGFFGLMYMLLGGAMVGLGASMGSTEAAPAGGVFGIIGGAFLVVFLVIALICGLLIISGLKLWRMKNSGRIMTIIFYGLTLVLYLMAIATIGGNVGVGTYLFMAISAAIIGYLFMPDTSKRFTSSR